MYTGNKRELVDEKNIKEHSIEFLLQIPFNLIPIIFQKN
jgi:hypothetical protein